MKPFNLQDALAGRPMVCDGAEVELVAYVPKARPGQQIVVLRGFEVLIFGLNGLSDTWPDIKLEINSVKSVVWINVYRDNRSGHVSSGAGNFTSEEAAALAGKNNGPDTTHLDTFAVTVTS